MSTGRWRFIVANVLRLVGNAALLAVVAVVFHQPLGAILGNEIKAAGRRLGLTQLGLTGWVNPQGAKGFLVNATSVPPGGTLLIDDMPRGTTPTVSNVACSEGQPINLKVEKKGFITWERKVLCREGETLLIRARLSP